MDKLLRLKKSKQRLQVVGNIGSICVIFVLISFIFAFVILALSIRIETSFYSNRAEKLTGLRSMMRSLVTELDEGRTDKVNETSRYIRESGQLSALSNDNKWKLYSFLKSLQSIDVDEYNRCVAYARECVSCVEHELYGLEYNMSRWDEYIKSSDGINGKTAINIAKLNSIINTYPSLFFRNSHVVTYGSNYYKKIEEDNVYEYLYLSNTFNHNSESCDVGYLTDKVHDYVKHTNGSGKLIFLFCEMGVAFFSYVDNFVDITVGISTDGEHLYLYSQKDIE